MVVSHYCFGPCFWIRSISFTKAKPPTGALGHIPSSLLREHKWSLDPLDSFIIIALCSFSAKIILIYKENKVNISWNPLSPSAHLLSSSFHCKTCWKSCLKALPPLPLQPCTLFPGTALMYEVAGKNILSCESAVTSNHQILQPFPSRQTSLPFAVLYGQFCMVSVFEDLAPSVLEGFLSWSLFPSFPLKGRKHSSMSVVLCPSLCSPMVIFHNFNCTLQDNSPIFILVSTSGLASFLLGACTGVFCYTPIQHIQSLLYTSHKTRLLPLPFLQTKILIFLNSTPYRCSHTIPCQIL